MDQNYCHGRHCYSKSVYDRPVIDIKSKHTLSSHSHTKNQTAPVGLTANENEIEDTYYILKRVALRKF